MEIEEKITLKRRVKPQLNIKPLTVSRLRLPFLNEFLFQRVFNHLEFKEFLQVRLVCYALKKLITNDCKRWFPLYWQVSRKKVREPKQHDAGYFHVSYSVAPSGPDGFSYYCLSRKNQRKYQHEQGNLAFWSNPENYHLCSVGAHGVFDAPELDWRLYLEGENYFSLIIDQVYKKVREAKGKNSIERKYQEAYDDYMHCCRRIARAKVELEKWSLYYAEARKRGQILE